MPLVTAGPSDGLVEIQLLGIPLALYGEAAEHSDELRRELSLIHQGADEHSVPIRLQRLVDELGARFGTFTAPSTGALHAALARGDERIDLTYRVPPEVKEASTELAVLLDEADAFCLAGEHLLTLATAPRPLAFRRWFLGEFVAQVDGRSPVPWDELAAMSPDA